MKAKAPAKRLPPARSSALAAARSGFAPPPADLGPGGARRPGGDAAVRVENRQRVGAADAVSVHCGDGLPEDGDVAGREGLQENVEGGLVPRVELDALVDALAVLVDDAGAAELALQRLAEVKAGQNTA